MTRRLVVFVVVAALAIVVGAVGALALMPAGEHDPGPYAACVNTKSGAMRMVDPVGDPPWPDCQLGKEYSIGWADGYTIRDFSNTNYYGEDATASTWFHQLACPEDTEPLGGGGAFLPDDEGAAQMALQSSVPTTDDDLGGLHGWEVFFASVDGLPHSGTFQVFAICAPVTKMYPDSASAGS